MDTGRGGKTKREVLYIGRRTDRQVFEWTDKQEGQLTDRQTHTQTDKTDR